ncbi:MAG: hypothetical protein HY537_09495 [Deltaproteobacteria bacterium]|nr:hypothetical protein [Deltaproteobacteria bacterium]
MKRFMVCCILFIGLPSFAAPSGNIVEVTKRLRLSSAEAMPPKDYFIDVGTKHGINEGSVLEVKRVILAMDRFSGMGRHFIPIVLGELRVVAAGEYSSIARVHSQRSLDQLPSMDYSVFMLGDSVEMKSALPFQP